MVSGNYYDTSSAFNGCDSIIVTDLSFVTYVLTSVPVGICIGDSYFAGGANQTTSGLYYDTLASSSGCDSIVETDLDVVSSFFIINNATICSNETYFAGGANQNTTGTYIDSLLASGGCDSVVRTNLTVLPISNSSRTITICSNESFFAGGANQNTSGNYYDTFTSVNGCDSILETVLIVNPAHFISRQISICNGDSLFVSGTYQTIPGVYYDSLTTSDGCDSVVETTLNTVSFFLIQQSFTLCYTDSFFAGGAYQNTDGLYIDSLVATGGCDSIIETTLQFVTTLYSNTQASICDGESYFVGGAEQTTSGNYNDTLMTAGGCDSVVTTTLTVLPEFTTTIDTTICDGESIFAGGAYQTTSGTYTEVLQSSNTCDSTVVINLTVGVIGLSGDTTIVCEGMEATLTGASGFLSYYWNPTGDTSSSISAGAGLYELVVTDQYGCTESVWFVVNQAPAIGLYVLPYDSTLERGESVQVEVISANGVSPLFYDWSPSTGLSCVNCSNPLITRVSDTLYTVIAMDNNGCLDTVSVFVDILNPLNPSGDIDPIFYVPNAFSPNGDYNNEIFKIKVTDFVSFRLLIFDRWGEKLFESSHPDIGWDGTFRGILLQPGVYVYYLDIKFIEGVVIPEEYLKHKKGSLTLIR